MNFEVQASSRPLGFHPHSAEENLSIAVDHCLSIARPRALSLKFAPGHRQSSTAMHTQATTGRRVFPGDFSLVELSQPQTCVAFETDTFAVVDSQMPRFSTTANYFNF